MELTLGGFGVLAQLQQAEGEPSSPVEPLRRIRRAQLSFLPQTVRVLQRRRKACHLMEIERWQLAPHGQAVAAAQLSKTELAAPGEGPDEGRVTPVLGAETERPGGVGKGKVEALRFGVEAGRKPTEEPRGGRAE